MNTVVNKAVETTVNTIFVEGKADKRFIEQVVSYLTEHIRVIPIHGYTRIQEYKNAFIETTDSEGCNIVILDADDNLVEKKQLLEGLKKDQKLRFVYFFLPDNHSGGTLEDLLLKCTVRDHQDIIDCFEHYEKCISRNTAYTVPNKKAKIYAYLEAIYSKKESKLLKEETRDYSDEAIWNLNIPEVRKFSRRNL